MDREIRECCETTQLVDTHEHLVEEETRTQWVPSPFFPAGDWADLLLHYTADDLMVSGWGMDDRNRFFAPDTAIRDKVRLLMPVWLRIRHTGYGMTVRETVRALYGEDDLTPSSIPRIAERYKEGVKPGFYRTLLRDHAGLTHSQVNSLERIFCQTSLPELLHQDISFLAFSLGDRTTIERELGSAPDTFEGWCGLIDSFYEEWAPRAVAAKNQIAYMRRLDFHPVDPAAAARVFARRVSGKVTTPEEEKLLQNALFRHCVQASTRHGLPVKLHTGYYAGYGRMPLERVGANASDLAPLLQEFPDTRFVLMHLGWPFQDQFLALAKQFPNVWIDMCWTWIINPEASVRFVREFLTTAPANKLLPFGGDFATAECVVGHARIARRGLAQAFSDLVGSGWIAREEALELIPMVFHGNAEALFPRPTVT